MLDPLAAYLAQSGAKAKEETSLIQPVVTVELFMTQTSVRQVASNWCPELDGCIQTVPEQVWLEEERHTLLCGLWFLLLASL